VIDQERGQGSAHDGQACDCGDNLIASTARLLFFQATGLLTFILLARNLAFALVAA
jgi:hypothetical protein